MPRNNVPPPIDFANLSDRESSILRRKLEQNYKKLISAGTEREKSIWEYAMRCVEEDGNFRIAYALSQLKVVPVPIDDFVEDPDYLGDIVEIWPSLKADLRVMNPDVFVGEAPVHEVLIGGATGTGKTTLSQVILLYQIYCFSCFEDPRPLFSLAPDTPIVFAIQSLSPIVTERVIYRPLRRMFERMPYAQRHLGWNKQNKSVLELENGLIIAPMLASVEAMAGQAILGGIIDEVNFMARTKNSVRVPGPRGLGGHYDQAMESYHNLTRRRKSRFTTQGLSLGVVCVISSARYKGDFLDRRMEQVEIFGELNVIVRRYKRYDVGPFRCDDRGCADRAPGRIPGRPPERPSRHRRDRHRHHLSVNRPT